MTPPKFTPEQIADTLSYLRKCESAAKTFHVTMTSDCVFTILAGVIEQLQVENDRLRVAHELYVEHTDMRLAQYEVEAALRG